MSFGAGAFKVEAVVVPIRKYYICKYYDKDTRYQKQKKTGLFARTRAFVLLDFDLNI